ncbi:hypothetical protein NB705_001148 [Xanthomonas sacchari]|nr:hypothetical protein [Xanthomonas sacchari]
MTTLTRGGWGMNDGPCQERAGSVASEVAIKWGSFPIMQ